MYQWRKFQFFEDRIPSAPLLPDLLNEELLCSTSGRGQISFGSEKGSVHVVDRSLKVKYSFQAHQSRVVHVQQLKQKNLLVTVGEEDGSSSSALASTTLKLWDLDKFSGEGAASPVAASSSAAAAADSSGGSSSAASPTCMRSIKVFPPKFPEAKIAHFSVLEEAHPVLLIAFGLDSGFVYLIRGDVSRERVARIKLAVDPALNSKPAAPITGLGFRQEGAQVQLFAVSQVSVNVFDMSSPQQAPQKRTLDLLGCPNKCVVMSDCQELVAGRQEAVYFYDADGRGPCWAFEGPKHRLAWFRSYLLIVAADPRKAERSLLTIYDLKNKLIAHSAPVPGGGEVAHLLCEWGAVVVVTRDGRAAGLGEKDMGSKLEMLFRKSLYNVAINLVQGQHADAAATAEVMRKYGDHLYSKQDYDEAMAQYIRTLGQLEPSYVIQKYLDAQRIHNLTRYLERLHDRGLATADHTTLLLNCYTKLKDVEKLDKFIRGDGGASGGQAKALAFDVDTVVRVCRAAGYFQHALFVAQQAGEHDAYLRILLHDLGQCDDALAYVAGLPTHEAVLTFQQYGTTLVLHKPAETTALLLSLCTAPAPAPPPAPTPAPTSAPAPAAEAAAATAAATAGAVVAAPGAGGEGSSSSSVARGRAALQREGLLRSEAKQKQLPSPLDFVHIYVDSPAWLMRFLEQYTARVRDSRGHAEIHDTLLQLYLCRDLSAPLAAPSPSSSSLAAASAAAAPAAAASAPSPAAAAAAPTAAAAAAKAEASGSESERERQKKALSLLRAAWPAHEAQPCYDADLAVVLCEMHGCRDGLLFLYERMKLYKEVIACYMQDADYKGLIACCKRLGDASRGGNPELWSDVLAFFGERGEDCSQEVRQVLEVLERDSLVSPLVVLQTLAKNEALTLGVVRDYVTRQIVQETDAIERDRLAIDKYREETAAMRVELHDLKTNARIFQLSKCTACTYALDLPAVHFLCMHSFHQRCLGDENECPLCAASNRTVLDMKRSLEQNANNHDQFFQLVQNSDDGFSVIAEYFGRGILSSKPPPDAADRSAAIADYSRSVSTSSQ